MGKLTAIVGLSRRDNFLRGALNLTAGLRARAARTSSHRHYCILFSSWHGSLGDEAMAVALVTELRRRDPSAEMTLLVASDTDAASLGHLGVQITSLPGVFVGKRAPLRLLWQIHTLTRRVTDVIVIGADVMDGHYSNSRSIRRLMLAEFAQAHGIRGHILGFSFSDQASPEMQTAFAELDQNVSLVCRDPLSAERLSALRGGQVAHGADLAFLLPPAPTDRPAIRTVMAQITTWRGAGHRIVGVNVNALALGRLEDWSPEAVIEAHVSLITRLHERTNCAFVLIPHDYRGAEADDRMLNAIAERLPEGLRWSQPGNKMIAAEAKTLAQALDLLVTGRMHLGIAALGSGRPAVMFDYQGKVQGLLSLFDAHEMTFGSDALRATDRLADRLANMLAEIDPLHARIAAKVDTVKALSQTHIDVICERPTPRLRSRRSRAYPCA